MDTEIEYKVKEAINQGKNSCTVYIDSQPVYKVVSHTGFHQQVMEQLRSLGYSVSFGRYGETYIPRGLLDESSQSVPEYTNYGFQISW